MTFFDCLAILYSSSLELEICSERSHGKYILYKYTFTYIFSGTIFGLYIISIFLKWVLAIRQCPFFSTFSKNPAQNFSDIILDARQLKLFNCFPLIVYFVNKIHFTQVPISEIRKLIVGVLLTEINGILQLLISFVILASDGATMKTE